MGKIRNPKKNCIYIVVKNKIIDTDERIVVRFDHRVCANFYCEKLDDEYAEKAEGILDTDTYSIVYI